jgi:hypothetical protein
MCKLGASPPTAHDSPHGRILRFNVQEMRETPDCFWLVGIVFIFAPLPAAGHQIPPSYATHLMGLTGFGWTG